MIILDNETDFKPDFDLQETADKVFEAVLSGEGAPPLCEAELLITDSETVRELNRDFRDIDKTTDVLSFPNIEWTYPADFSCKGAGDDMTINPETGNIMLGQIVLNDEKIVSQAEEYGHGIKREYAFLIAHSVLHLLGYDHMTDEEAAIMEKKQSDYLKAIDITR